jgi:hypothetical protein
MVAKKFILPTPNLLTLTILSRKTKELRIQMEMMLREEIGGKDLSITEALPQYFP